MCLLVSTASTAKEHEQCPLLMASSSESCHSISLHWNVWISRSFVRATRGIPCTHEGVWPKYWWRKGLVQRPFPRRGRSDDYNNCDARQNVFIRWPWGDNCKTVPASLNRLLPYLWLRSVRYSLAWVFLWCMSVRTTCTQRLVHPYIAAVYQVLWMCNSVRFGANIDWTI